MPKVGVANTNVDHLEVVFVITDLGTRNGELYAPDDEVLMSDQLADAGATDLGRGEEHTPDVRTGAGRFARSRERFELIVGWFGGEQSDELAHAEWSCGLRRMVMSCCACCSESSRSSRRAGAARGTGGGSCGVACGAVECDHQRPLASVFGEVTVSRLAYRRRGQENLYVADGALNLPDKRASHGSSPRRCRVLLRLV